MRLVQASRPSHVSSDRYSSKCIAGGWTCPPSSGPSLASALKSVLASVLASELLPLRA